MKEITITTTIKVPTNDEIKEVAKNFTPIEPQQAMLITCFVYGYEYESEPNKAVYECMKEADGIDKSRFANDVAVAYCTANNIKWHTVRVISVIEYAKHFVIEAVATV